MPSSRSSSGLLKPSKPAENKLPAHSPMKSGSISTLSSTFQLPSPALDPTDKKTPHKNSQKQNSEESGSPASMKKDGSSAKKDSTRNERTPLLEPSMPAIVEGQSNFTRKKSFVENFNDNIFNVVKRRSSSLINPETVSYLRRRGSLIPAQELIQLDNSFETDKAEFLSWLDLELNKINTFFKKKESQSVQRYLLLQDQLVQLREHRQNKHNLNEDGDYESSVKEPEEGLTRKLAGGGKQALSKFRKWDLPSLPRFRFLDKDLANNSDPLYDRRDYKKNVTPAPVHVPYSLAKRQLKHAILEFYRSLELLKSYRALNRTACRKMIKKFDKTTDSYNLPEFMSSVNKSYFVTSDVLENLMSKVENLFTFYICNGNRKMAIEKLRSKMKPEEHYGPLFFGGLFIGVSIPLIIFAIIKGARDRHMYPEYSQLLQIWGAFILSLGILLSFTVHFYVWDIYKINYKFIFDFNIHNALDFRQYIFLPSLLLLLGTLISYYSFENDYGWPKAFLPRDMPWIFVGLALTIFLVPLPILYYKSRRWLQITIWRLLLSGFYPVEFKDFFVGDIFCSLTYSMSNISLFICLYSTHWELVVRCGSSQSRVLGFLSTLPSIWRFLQCFRRYADTGEWFPHLANMAKYGVGIVYYMTLSFYRIDNSDVSKKAIFIVFASLNSVYSAIWDVFMDWSLLQMDSKNKLLRNNLGYKHKNFLYYCAIVIDVILRFQWVFYVFFPRTIQHSALTSFGVAFAEAIRRFIWVFFRMENEHCTNVNLLKASRETALPYPVSFRVNPAIPTPSIHAQDEDSGVESGSEDLEENKPQSFFRTISRAMTSAHVKDFQRPKRKHDEPANSDEDDGDEDDDDDYEMDSETQIDG